MDALDARTIADANRFAGATIANSINAGAENIADALHDVARSNEEIAKSNRQIARNVLRHSRLTLAGLSKIADELERKRCTDEYYILLEKIDILEDKFISADKNLNEVYDNLSFTPEEKIDITPFELKLLNYLMPYEETANWFLSLIVFYKTKKPLDLICRIFEISNLSNYRDGDRFTRLYVAYNDHMYFYLSDYTDEFDYSIVKEECFDQNGNIIDAAGILSYLADKYIDDEVILLQEKLNSLVKLQNFFAEQNSKIDLNNLRLLYEALFNAYHDFKLSKNEA